MSWKPITESDLLELLASCIKELDRETLAKLDSIRVPLRRVRCKRGQIDDSLYVIAQRGSSALVFDDVEEEFGIATLGADDVVVTWQLHGLLVNALNGV
jgi:hypothetical protein